MRRGGAGSHGEDARCEPCRPFPTHRETLGSLAVEDRETALKSSLRNERPCRDPALCPRKCCALPGVPKKQGAAMLRPQSHPYLRRYGRSLRPCLAAPIIRLATGDHFEGSSTGRR